MKPGKISYEENGHFYLKIPGSRFCQDLGVSFTEKDEYELRRLGYELVVPGRVREVRNTLTRRTLCYHSKNGRISNNAWK